MRTLCVLKKLIVRNVLRRQIFILFILLFTAKQPRGVVRWERGEKQKQTQNNTIAFAFCLLLNTMYNFIISHYTTRTQNIFNGTD